MGLAHSQICDENEENSLPYLSPSHYHAKEWEIFDVLDLGSVGSADNVNLVQGASNLIEMANMIPHVLIPP